MRIMKADPLRCEWEILQQVMSYCYNQIPSQLLWLLLFLQWSPKLQTLVKYPHGSTENEHELAFQCLKGKEQQISSEWDRSVQKQKQHKNRYKKYKGTMIWNRVKTYLFKGVLWMICCWNHHSSNKWSQLKA